jgi:Phage Mu protein F like protein.
MIIRFGEVRKEDIENKALQALRTFLDGKEPLLVQFLQRTWKHQGAAITYKEIREAILSAKMGTGIENIPFFNQTMDLWQQDYARVVVERIAPAWEKAARQATGKIIEQVSGLQLRGYEDGIRSWINDVSATFITNTTETQINALKHVVRRAAEFNDLSVDTLAHTIRPMIGLTEPQARANMNYFQSMIENGVSEKVAVNRAAKYAEKQHRYRAYDIARTELAYAYNHGADVAVREAQKIGLLGEMKKQWITAEDERVCSVCGQLDGITIEMSAEFDFSTKLTYPGIRLQAPAHPKCRCVVIYIEVSDTGIKLNERRTEFAEPI